MSVTFPLTVPDHNTRRVRLRVEQAVSVSISPFSGREQTQEHPGDRWVAEIELPPMKRAAAEAWLCFLLKLRGQVGSFLMGDPLARSPQGSPSGIINATSTGVGTNVMTTDSGGSGDLVAGDYITTGSGSNARLYKVVNSVSLPSATLDVVPKQRGSGSISWSNTVGLWRLDQNFAEWSADQIMFGVTFRAVEDRRGA